MAAKKLVYYLIPLVVLILLIMWIFAPTGLFEGMKEAVEGIIGLAPNVSMGAEELKGEKPTIPEEHKEAVSGLKATIEKMLASNRTNCFANYGELPDLGEKGTKIVFKWRKEKNLTEIIVGGGAGGKQEVSHEEIKGMKPCVIAGSKEITKNFYFLLMYSQDPSFILQKPYFKEVNSISIYYKSANHIEVGDFGQGGPVNDWDDNFEDGGWLFKAENGIICFFPTNFRVNHDEDGIENKFINDPGEEKSIPAGIARGDLKLCSLPVGEEWIKYKSIEIFGEEECLVGTCPNPRDRSWTIHQTCPGFVGKDCTSKDGDCDNDEFPTELPSKGCLIMASEYDPGRNDCGYAVAKEGSIIASHEYNFLDYQNYVSKDNEPDPEKLFKDWKWISKEPLLCFNKYWYVCREENVGKQINNPFICEKKEGVLVWGRVG